MSPIERVEILRQVESQSYKNLNAIQTLKKIIQTQGILGPFKGNSASIARIFPFSAIEFYSFEFFKNLIVRGQKDRQNSIYYTSICGALTGLTAITLTFPLDVARTRLAVITSTGQNNNIGLLKSVSDLYKDYGLKGLYKGYSSAFIVIIINKYCYRDLFLM